MVLYKAQLSVDDGTMTKSSVEITDPADDSATPQTELKDEAPEQPDPSTIEVVSVTEEDLPTVETPNTVIVSPLDSFTSVPQPESQPATPKDPKAAAPESPNMPITKVQPFIHEDDLDKSWKSRLLLYRFELMIATVVTVTLILCISLGVSLRCAGKFHCRSSKCISPSAQCDGVAQCDDGEDELGCVRLSGRSSVLQVQMGGVWRTICSEDWTSQLGLLACRQLGYPWYVESAFVRLDSIEQDLQTRLVSIVRNQSEISKLHIASTHSKSECSSGMVATLKCLECGSRPYYTARRSQTRIVGGNMSSPGQFPWQVSLQFMGLHMCGGSIVAPHWILTAAHCVHGFSDPSMWTVHVGQTVQDLYSARSHAVEQILYHHSYSDKNLANDVALMRLVTPLTFNGFVQPICLPNHEEEFEDGTMCWISGWGATDEDGDISMVLNSAMVPLLPSKTCNQPQVLHGLVTSGMICAGHLEGGIDTCQGDSGGPLACQRSSVWKLVGATSWGFGCAVINKPGVYTRITKFLSWIHQQMERGETSGALTPNRTTSV